MIDLATDLGVNKVWAVGIVESLIGWAAEYRPTGAIGQRCDNKTIARELGYDGDPDKLMAALVTSGWVEESPDPRVRLFIHDWSQHCEDTVHARVWKLGLTFADGGEIRRKVIPSEWRGKPNPNQPPPEHKNDGHRVPSDSHRTSGDSHGAQSGASVPAPASAPASVPVTRQAPPKAAAPSPESVPIPLSIDTPEVREHWSEWIANCRERRKPLTARAAKMQLKDLEAMGPERACAAIRHSIGGRYQGIFEPKDNGNGRAGSTAKTTRAAAGAERRAAQAAREYDEPTLTLRPRITASQAGRPQGTSGDAGHADAV